MNIDKTLHKAVDYLRSGNFHAAEEACKAILERHPNNIDVLHLFGIIYLQLNNLDLAIDYLKKTIHLDPSNADTYFNLGNALYKKEETDDAITCYQKAIQLDPQFAPPYNNLGNALHDKGDTDGAIEFYQKAIQLDPQFAPPHNNLGNALYDKGDIDGAIEFYQKAIKLDPSYVEAYFSLGNIYRTKGYPDHAIKCYQEVLRFKPDFAEAYNNIGVAFMDKGNSDEAVVHFQKALSLKPSFGEALCNLFYEFQQTCTWQALESLTAQIDNLTFSALHTGTKPAESPFLAITRHDDASLHLSIAQSWSRSIARDASYLKTPFSFDGRKKDKEIIVIGYLSNEFRNHATAHLMLSLFGLHNRDKFRVHCYSYGKDDGSSYREIIRRDCDKFVDIYNLSYVAAAKSVFEDQIDILIDLKGYSRDCRIAICAFRPAPVQVSYLGFPGTTGADFIDYLITDKIVTPEAHEPYYSEKFVFMPDCYQANDHNQPISSRVWLKGDFGLPENSFVFASFNHSYKIDPFLFDIWMKILQQVPESVLWLLFTNKTAEGNLRREAEARGVKSDRLIFAEWLPKHEHLSRLRLVDLALDTRIVNGHATTSDVLWAGAPVITLQGRHFASRVSSSALSAVGLPELTTHTLEEYKALAVRLAMNPVELKQIRDKLAKNRLINPLFDTPQFVRNLESAYTEMWKIYLKQETPRQIFVKE